MRYILIVLLIGMLTSGCTNNPDDFESSTIAASTGYSSKETHVINTSPLTNEEAKISGYFHMKKGNDPVTWVEFREDRSYWENKEENSTRRWEITDDKLIINCYSKSGDFIGSNIYSFEYIDENTFTLIYDDLQFEYICTRVDKF